MKDFSHYTNSGGDRQHADSQPRFSISRTHLVLSTVSTFALPLNFYFQFILTYYRHYEQGDCTAGVSREPFNRH